MLVLKVLSPSRFIKSLDLRLYVEFPIITGDKTCLSTCSKRGGGFSSQIRVRRTQNCILSAMAAFIDGSGRVLYGGFFFSRTTHKSGYFSAPSAACADVKAKI